MRNSSSSLRWGMKVKQSRRCDSRPNFLALKTQQDRTPRSTNHRHLDGGQWTTLSLQGKQLSSQRLRPRYTNPQLSTSQEHRGLCTQPQAIFAPFWATPITAQNTFKQNQKPVPSPLPSSLENLVCRVYTEHGLIKDPADICTDTKPQTGGSSALFKGIVFPSV